MNIFRIFRGRPHGEFHLSLLNKSCGGGQGAGNPGVIGAGSEQEAGEERVGDRIPEEAEVRRNRK